MKKMIKILLAAVLIVACGCQKEEIVTQNSDQIVVVTADAGVHSFGVTTPGAWSVTMDEESKEWCEFVGPDYGNGIGAFSVKYDENKFDGVRRGLRRQAVFTITTGDKFTSITIYFRQSGITPKLEFREKSYTFAHNSLENVLTINTNLSVFEAADINYSVVGEWITNSRISPNGTEIVVTNTANESEEVERKATAEISYTDSWGDTFKATTEIVQKVKPIIPEMFEPVKPGEDDDEL